jgi:inositol phosphorylceramide mannosyltransferase catalytic subunit
MIPRIVHQTWRAATLAAPADGWHQTWRDLNPGFEHRFYDDAACVDFVRAQFPSHLESYLRLPLPILRADLFRYMVLHRLGGVYADIDMECLRSFDRFTRLSGLLLSVETKLTDARRRELGYRRRWQLANCVLAAEPGHWFLEMLIDRITDQSAAEARTDDDVEDWTGPRLLTRLYYELPARRQAEIGILAQLYWMPPTSYPNRWPVNARMYARHHFQGSWKSRSAAAPLPLSRRIVRRNLLPNPWPRGLWQFRAPGRPGTGPAGHQP